MTERSNAAKMARSRAEARNDPAEMERAEEEFEFTEREWSRLNRALRAERAQRAGRMKGWVARRS